MSTPENPAPLSVEVLERYWAATLLPFAPGQGVPLDCPRPASEPMPPHSLTLAIPADLSAAILRTCQQKPSLALALLLTTYQILLHRQHAAEQVCVLTPASGDASTNRWLAIKTTIDPEQTVAELLEQVRSRLADAFAHQEFPFSRVVQLVGSPWPANRAPLSDLAVAVEGVSRMDVLADVKSDITVLAAVESETLHVTLAYRAELFGVDTIRSLGEQLVCALAEMLERPHGRVRDVRLMSPEQESALVARFRDWDTRAWAGRRVDELVLDTIAAMPEGTAFVHGAASLTYAELGQRARALADRLLAAGVQPGERVAVALDTSLALPVALLGTLLCGAAFVPLDPRHPIVRLHGILTQARPVALICEARLRNAFDGVVPVLDWDPAAPSPGPVAPIAIRDLDNALAYVMFTSGSTGEPSGVCVSHASFANYLLWAKEYYLGDARPAFALYSSIAFDLTLTSVFLPLVAGCTAVMFSFEDGVVDMDAIFADRRIGVVKATPSHLKLLRMDRAHETGVRIVIVGGEAFEWELASAVQEAFGPSGRVFNEYGPTEATIGSTVHRFDPAETPAAIVPLGHAIANTGIYVLDEQRRPSPVGMPGELWISGTPVAAGYLDAPERTGERFVDDPFNLGQRMYRTGDRVRYDSIGRLHYLGRSDDQIKFKGVRIELGDLRAALVRLPRIRDAVVRVLDDEHRNQILVAYYVARQSLDISLVRAGLQEVLPAEMMPNLFVRMPKLPLTLNGKVDVHRLPSLDEIRRAGVQQFVAPRTEAEKAIAAVWSEVLGVTEISVHSNFFALGGHSLLASQVAWKTTERLGVEMPLRMLFDLPTVGQLAAAFDAHVGTPPPAPSGAIDEVPSEGGDIADATLHRVPR